MNSEEEFYDAVTGEWGHSAKKEDRIKRKL